MWNKILDLPDSLHRVWTSPLLALSRAALWNRDFADNGVFFYLFADPSCYHLSLEDGSVFASFWTQQCDLSSHGRRAIIHLDHGLGVNIHMIICRLYAFLGAEHNYCWIRATFNALRHCRANTNFFLQLKPMLLMVCNDMTLSPLPELVPLKRMDIGNFDVRCYYFLTKDCLHWLLTAWQGVSRVSS